MSLNITIFGSGYIGCVVAAGLAECGHSVSLFTRHPKEWEKSGGVPPFYEPELDQVWESQCDLGRLALTSDITSDVPESDVVMFCLGTPAREDGKCDTSGLMEAIENASKFMRPGAVLVVKSTVPVGTCREIDERLERSEFRIPVVSNPEFLREGSALKEFRSGKGIVVGARTEEAFAVMRKLYQPILNGETIAEMSPESAEFTKLASNSLLAVKVAAGNELSAAAESLGADFRDVAASLKQNPNIGGYGLIPGPGIGGSCFGKDSQTLCAQADWHGAPLSIIGAFKESDESYRRWILTRKVLNAFTLLNRGACFPLRYRKFTVLGVTYKAHTDDLRGSPALGVIDALQKAGAWVSGYDPEGMEKARKVTEDVDWTGPYSAIKDSDGVVICTEWPEFAQLDWERIFSEIRSPIIVDLRNILDEKKMEGIGFDYHGVGY